MHLPTPTLLDLLQNNNPDAITTHENEPASLSATEMGHLYVQSAMLATSADYLTEQLWLQKRDDRASGTETAYQDFLSPLLERELLSARQLKGFLLTQGPTRLKAIHKEALRMAASVLSSMVDRSDEEQKLFLIESLEEMSSHYLYEEQLQEGRQQSLGHLGPCLYRTFDELDEIFDLSYHLDREIKQGGQPKERLYEGAGANVQSGYSTILLALHHLDLQADSKVVDLGSGFGRVGLVCALLHPDVDFVGYEYVPHRVDVSNRAASSLGLEEGLQFITQDLSLESFDIPVADVYYLYDPFTKETYQYVLAQIVEISQEQPVTIVTKGNARHWLDELAQENQWPEPLLIDEGNLALFKSA